MTHRIERDESVPLLANHILGRLDSTGEGRLRAAAVSAWRATAGEDVFAHARGFALRDGELLVFVDLPVWANELVALSEIYRTGINERLGKETVTSMRFAVSRKVEETVGVERDEGRVEAERAADKASPVALTEEEREAVEMMTAVIENEDLRKSATAATIAHFEWRKGIEAKIAAEKAVQRP